MLLALRAEVRCVRSYFAFSQEFFILRAGVAALSVKWRAHLCALASFDHFKVAGIGKPWTELTF
jgi:hypothetical protein